jgi:hypothetical protein
MSLLSSRLFKIDHFPKAFFLLFSHSSTKCDFKAGIVFKVCPQAIQSSDAFSTSSPGRDYHQLLAWL